MQCGFVVLSDMLVNNAELCNFPALITHDSALNTASGVHYHLVYSYTELVLSADLRQRVLVYCTSIQYFVTNGLHIITHLRSQLCDFRTSADI
jgi:hypothetical protein